MTPAQGKARAKRARKNAWEFRLSPEAWPRKRETARAAREDREIEKLLAEYGIEEM